MNTENQLVELQHTLYTSSNPTRRSLHCTRRDWIFEAIKRYSGQRSNSNALEVGPGSGIYLPVLTSLFDNVTAVDIEEAYLNNARNLVSDYSNLSLKVDDILNSTLPDAYFDFILCTEVLEHIQNSTVAIAQMRRLLRPGGTMLISTPQRYSPLEMTAKIAFLPGIIEIVRMIYQEPILETGHINLMTERQVLGQLSASGLKLVEQHKSGLYIPFVAEFMGQTGLRLERWIEKKIRGSALDGVLWTQYYVVEA